MSNFKKTIFISDVHLQDSEPHITAQFLQFLAQCDASVAALYILGDLFEVWIGDDTNSLFHQQIIQALTSLTQRGIRVYFMHGNRDFLIGKKFAQQSGCELLPEETVINLYGSKVLLMHGDTLCTRDVTYIQARKKMRQPLLQKLFLFLPLNLRSKIAAKMRAKSQQHTQLAASDVMDVTQEEVVRVMQKHAVDFLIHGHTHRPAFHDFTIEQTSKLRIVLGAWHEHGNYLVWDETGKKIWLEI